LRHFFYYYSKIYHFYEYVLLGIRKHENGTMHHEENFEEAIRSVNFAYNRTTLPENVRLILKDEKLKNLTSNVSI